MSIHVRGQMFLSLFASSCSAPKSRTPETLGALVAKRGAHLQASKLYSLACVEADVSEQLEIGKHSVKTQPQAQASGFWHGDSVSREKSLERAAVGMYRQTSVGEWQQNNKPTF